MIDCQIFACFSSIWKVFDALMGRIPMGGTALGSQHDANHGLWERKATAKGVIVMRLPSRRRPDGFYSILGVSVDATPLEIRQAYRKKALQLHPDKHSAQKLGACTKAQQELNDAYAILKDVDQRAKYDLKIRPTRAVPGAESTTRVRVHRARQTTIERKISVAINSARVKLKSVPAKKRKKASTKAAARSPKIVARRWTSAKSRIAPPRRQWFVAKREKADKTKDKRRTAKFVAFLD